MRITPPKIILFIIFFTTFILLYEPLVNDGGELLFRMPENSPIHILSDHEVVEIYKELGYRASYRTQPFFIYQFYYYLVSREPTVCTFLEKEVVRKGRNLNEAFNNATNLEFLAKLRHEKDNALIWRKSWHRTTEAIKRKQNKNERTLEILQILEQGMSDLKKIGYERWGLTNYVHAADICLDYGQNEKALRYFDRALTVCMETKNYEMGCIITGKFAVHYDRQGDFEEAERLYRLNVNLARLNNVPTFTARAYSFYGNFKADQGHLVEAESLYVQALSVCNDDCPPGIYTNIYQNLAELYYSLGEIASASYYAEKLVLVAEENIPKFPRDYDNMPAIRGLYRYLANGLSIQAKVKRRKGEIEDAIRIMERAVIILEDDADRHFAARNEALLGELYTSVGRYKKAEQCFISAYKTTKFLEEMRPLAKYLSALGALKIQTGQYKNAEILIEDALTIAKQENDWMQVIESTHLLGKLALQQGNHEKARNHWHLALSIFEDNFSTMGYTENRHAMVDIIDTIYSDLYELIADRYSNSETLVALAERARHISNGRRSIGTANFEKHIKHTLTDKDWIPENALIIQHLVTPQKTIAVAIDRYGATHRTIPITRERIEKEILSFLDLCNVANTLNSGDNVINDYKNIEAAAHKLYTLFLRPLLPLITSKDILCFIEDGTLSYLPFGALIASEENPQFLVETHTIIYSPSIFDLKPRFDTPYTEKSELAFQSALLIGDPEVPPLLEKLYPYLNDLPRTGREISSTKKFFKSCKVYQGADATKEAFMKNAQHSDLIHIATHTVRYPIYGGFASILLSPALNTFGDEKVESSLLTTEEIGKLNLSGTKLVVLSSCESATSNPSIRRGSNGLAGAFVQAGAEKIVATVWPIEDTAAEKFMTAFFRELFEDSSDPVEALCAVQRRIIAESRSRGALAGNIHDWAPFILVKSFSRGSYAQKPRKLISNSKYQH